MTKWVIYSEKESLATDFVSRAISRYADYQPRIFTSADRPADLEDRHNTVFVGDHPTVKPPVGGVRIKTLDNPSGTQTIVITGDGFVNTLYAASEFYGKYVPFARNADIHCPAYYFNRIFDGRMPDYDKASVPAFNNRGIWTWGHVIYDYKKLFENMVLMKLNTITIWNDHVPTNAKDIVDYAHACGIRVIWGFEWGWDTSTDHVDLTALDALSDRIVETFRTQYLSAGGDGIYFQSFTETKEETIGGILIADAVTRLVNQTASRLYDLKPDLWLQWGLHATSVNQKLAYIAKTDRRISIVWEDCGAFPYTYLPKYIENFAETEAFTDSIRTLRDGGFGVVFKGLICLDWSRFVHLQGEYDIGVSAPSVLDDVAAKRRDIWRYVQAWWVRNGAYAHRMLKHFDKDNELAVLLEDGALEKNIYYPAALFAEMMWSTDTTEEIISATGLMPFVDFA